MELSAREKSLKEFKQENLMLRYIVIALVISVFLALYKLVAQSEILIVQTPGMPANSVIQKTAFDKGAQSATLATVTNCLSAITPANAQYQKQCLGLYLSAEVYTKVMDEINAKVEKQKRERELGSTYFIFKKYEYDPKIDRHFVIGDLHTVNAAKDTTEEYVYEYQTHIENYRMWIDEIVTYPGNRPHNSEWLESAKK